MDFFFHFPLILILKEINNKSIKRLNFFFFSLGLLFQSLEKKKKKKEKKKKKKEKGEVLLGG
jgi:hypothetical protein